MQEYIDTSKENHVIQNLMLNYEAGVETDLERNHFDTTSFMLENAICAGIFRYDRGYVPGT